MFMIIEAVREYYATWVQVSKWYMIKINTDVILEK